MRSKLLLTTYKPNFNDPRVRRKAEAVLRWCDGMRAFKAGKIVHHDTLTEVFGNRSQGGLSEWLYMNLLSQVGHYEPGKRSFSYRLKESGYKKIHELLGSTPPTEVEVVKQQFSSLIAGIEEPAYKDNGSRRFHPIQNIKRNIRREVFADWWDYDIEACAPTLIHQFVTTSRWHQAIGGNDFPAVDRLINEKDIVRSEISACTGLEPQKVKELLSAIFFRGNPAPSPKAGIFRLLGSDIEKHHRFLNLPFIIQLRDDCHRLWIKATLFDGFERASGQLFEGKILPRRPKKAARLRMAIYLSLERKVIQVIEDEVSEQKVPFLLMHDGLMAQRRLDKSTLESKVRERLGFTVRLSESFLGEQDDLEGEVDPDQIMRGDEGEID